MKKKTYLGGSPASAMADTIQTMLNTTATIKLIRLTFIMSPPFMLVVKMVNSVSVASYNPTY
jgi:hypothetical protein